MRHLHGRNGRRGQGNGCRVSKLGEQGRQPLCQGCASDETLPISTTSSPHCVTTACMTQQPLSLPCLILSFSPPGRPSYHPLLQQLRSRLLPRVPAGSSQGAEEVPHLPQADKGQPGPQPVHLLRLASWRWQQQLHRGAAVGPAGSRQRMPCAAVRLGLSCSPLCCWPLRHCTHTALLAL